MRKWCVIYDLTEDKCVRELKVKTIDEAIALVREVIGDDIIITSVELDDLEYGADINFSRVISYESVVEAETEEKARNKVLTVLENADITNSWEVV